MTEWQTVCLAVIAISVALMAIIQIAFIVAGIVLVRQLGAISQDIRQELRPLMDKIHRVADDAVRTSSLAAAQVERVDRLLATTTTRVEATLSLLQDAMGGPVRQGAAAFMVMRAVFSAFRQWQTSRAKGTPRDDEDALFVG